MVVDKTKKCTGCGICSISCPRECLKIKLNDDGFYRPYLTDTTSCINCGICDKYCPVNFIVEEMQPLSSISARVNDSNVLMSTSSGGVCYELSKQFIDNDKKVCACVYNYKEHRAEHAVIDNLDGLEKTKGSKYLQSYTAKAFKDVFDGNEWIVFGTPCQISAIDSFAIKKGVRDKLLLVDFFCHGTPTMNLWKKYLLENNRDSINKIDFRSKEFGWHTYSLRFTYQDGSHKSDYNENMFYKFFFNHYVLNDSCYECKYKALKSKADIRVGDYWGEKFKGDTKGVSALVAFTEKGKFWLQKLIQNCDWQSEDINDILEVQMKKSPPLLKVRGSVLRALKGKRKLKTINNTTLLTYRIKCKIKSLFKRT